MLWMTHTNFPSKNHHHVKIPQSSINQFQTNEFTIFWQRLKNFQRSFWHCPFSSLFDWIPMVESAAKTFPFLIWSPIKPPKSFKFCRHKLQNFISSNPFMYFCIWNSLDFFVLDSNWWCKKLHYQLSGEFALWERLKRLGGFSLLFLCTIVPLVLNVWNLVT